MGIRRIWRSSKSQHGHRETPPRVVLQHTLYLADEVGSPGRLPRPWNSQVETCRQPPAMDGHEFFLEGERRSHQAPARRTWLAPKARQAPKHTPPCPPHLLPRPSLSIQHLVFVRRCRCCSFQEHTFDRKINKNRHHQSRRPTTPPLRRRTPVATAGPCSPRGGRVGSVGSLPSKNRVRQRLAVRQLRSMRFAAGQCGRPIWCVAPPSDTRRVPGIYAVVSANWSGVPPLRPITSCACNLTSAAAHLLGTCRGRVCTLTATPRNPVQVRRCMWE